MTLTRWVEELFSEEDLAVLRKISRSCQGCGLPAISRKEDVCPICGSTSWGWSSRGWGFVFGLCVGAFLVAGFLQDVVASLLPGVGMFWVALLLGLATFVRFYRWTRAEKFAQDPTPVALIGLAVIAFGPLVLLGCPVFPRLPDLLVFCISSVAWFFLGYDEHLAAGRQSPSLTCVIRVIDARTSRLMLNLVRIEDELERLGPGGKTRLIASVRDGLEYGRAMIRRELPELDAQRDYTHAIGRFLFWKNGLYSLFVQLPGLAAADLDLVEDINRGLRSEIRQVRRDITEAIAEGRAGAAEIADCINRSLVIHEMIRDGLAARRAQEVLTQIDLGRPAPMPQPGDPHVAARLDCSQEILDRVNACFHWIRQEPNP